MTTSASSTSTTAPTRTPSTISSPSTTSSSASGRRTASWPRRRCCSAASPRARSTAKPQDVPLLREKLAWLLENCRRRQQLARLSRDARAVQSLPAPRAALRRRVVAQGDARQDGLHVGRRRDRRHDAAGHGLRRRADRVLRPALLAQGGRGSQGRRSARRSARSRSTPGPTWASIALLVFYFDSETLEHPIDVDEVNDITRARRSRRGRIRSRVILDQTFGPLEGRRLFQPLHPHRDAQRPLSRIDAARGSAGGSQAVRTARSAARNERPARHRRIGDAEDLFAAAARPDRHAAHARRT